MSMRDYERAVDLIEREANGGDFAAPKPTELIAAAEEALGFTFAPAYRRFLAIRSLVGSSESGAEQGSIRCP